MSVDWTVGVRATGEKTAREPEVSLTVVGKTIVSLLLGLELGIGTGTGDEGDLKGKQWETNLLLLGRRI